VAAKGFWAASFAGGTGALALITWSNAAGLTPAAMAARAAAGVSCGVRVPGLSGLTMIWLS